MGGDREEGTTENAKNAKWNHPDGTGGGGLCFSPPFDSVRSVVSLNVLLSVGKFRISCSRPPGAVALQPDEVQAPGQHFRIAGSGDGAGIQPLVRFSMAVGEGEIAPLLVRYPGLIHQHPIWR